MVVDASVVFAALVTAGPDARWAEDMVARPVSAPHHLPVEVVHVLRREQLRGRIEKSAAALVLDDLDGLDVEYFDFSPLRERIWELRPTVSPYDAWYVALAEELGVPLATLDRQLANAPGPRCEFLVPPAPATRDEASALEGSGWDGDLEAMRDDPDPSTGR